MLHIFWAPYRTKCPGVQISTGHWHGVVIMKNNRTATPEPDLQTTKSVTVNSKWKVWVHWCDNQSWYGCHRVVSVNEVTFRSALQPTKHDVLWPCTIYMAAYFSQKKVSLQSGCTCKHVCILHQTEAWISWTTIASLSMASHGKTKGHMHFNWTKLQIGVGMISL